jgi:flagellar biogenesis protein FliO
LLLLCVCHSVEAAPAAVPTANPPAVTANVPPDAAAVDSGTLAQPRPTLGDEPIRGSTPASSPGASPDPAAGASSSGGTDYYRVLAALALVLGLIFLLRWFGRFFFPTMTGRGSRAIEVITRSPLSPKQQVMLIRVGRRLVLIGDSGSQLSPLCEITDPDEIAALVGQLRDDKGKAPGSAWSFAAAFSRYRNDHEAGAVGQESAASSNVDLTGDVEDPAEQAAVSSAREELNGLMDRVRSLKEQFAGS